MANYERILICEWSLQSGLNKWTLIDFFKYVFDPLPVLCLRFSQSALLHQEWSVVPCVMGPCYSHFVSLLGFPGDRILICLEPRSHIDMNDCFFVVTPFLGVAICQSHFEHVSLNWYYPKISRVICLLWLPFVTASFFILSCPLFANHLVMLCF